MQKDEVKEFELVYELNDEQKLRWQQQIPPELRAMRQWVPWRLERPDGSPKPKKVPYNVLTGKRASSTDPKTWTTFEDALNACYRPDGNYQGIGFMLTESDPFVGIDLDDCRSCDTGEIQPRAQDIITRLVSYTEVSPSGTGIRILLRGKLPGKGNRQGGIEVYDNARFLTITAHRVSSCQSVEERHDELVAWHGEVFPRVSAPSPLSNTGVNSCTDRELQLSDDQVLALAFKARNGSETRRLYNGDMAAHGDDHSRADLSLIKRLAFYTQDEGQLDALFRGSALYRPKWDEKHGKGKSYGRMTIDKALSDMPRTYSAVRHNCSVPKASSKAVAQDGTIAQTNSLAGSMLQAAPHRPSAEKTKAIGDSLDVQLQADLEATQGLTAIVPDLASSTSQTLSDGALPVEPQFRYLRPLSYLDTLPPREWLIDKILPCQAYSAIVGAPGCGKTFVMLDMAFCIACGISYHGRPVKQGIVVIIEAEGVDNLGARMRAWLAGHPQANRTMLEQNIALVPEAVQFCEEEQIQALLQDIQQLPTQPVLTIIDTLARANAGRDENSVRDMSLFVANCDAIRKATGGTVMVIHHSNKNDGIRGSTALPGALDTTILCGMNNPRTLLTMRCDKQKDGAPFEPISFTLKPDAGSGSIYLQLAAGSSGASRSEGGISSNDEQVLNAIKQATKEWLSLKDICALLPDASQSTLQKSIKRLVERQLLQSDGVGNRMRYRVPA